MDAAAGYRNGYGKRRRLSMRIGTVEVRRPRVRGVEERFESRVLPLFKAECERRRDRFISRYRKTCPKAVEILKRDWERMVAFYKVPKEHGRHLRTTNIVESPFAAVRLRTSAAKRFKKVRNAEALIWKLLMVAERSFRRLNSPKLSKDVYEGKKFVDGVLVKEQAGKLAA